MNSFKKDVLLSSGCASSPDHSIMDDKLEACGGCTFCREHLNTSTKFKSTVTQEQFSITDSGTTFDIACTTKNVVYLITCELCNIQYVGMTTNSLRTRFYGHRSAIKGGKVNTWLYSHFQSLKHRVHHCKVQIIYHYSKNDEDAKEVLLTVEEFYMRKLSTLHPFGLNDNINSMSMNLSNTDFFSLNMFNTPFFSFASPRRKRSHGHRKHNKQHISTDYIDYIIDKLFEYYKSFKLHDMYVLLRSLSRSILDMCVPRIDDYCKNNQHKSNSMRSIILAYRSQFIKGPKVEKEDFIYCNIPFIHKIMEKIGLLDLFKRKDIRCFLPHGARKLRVRTTFSYGPTIGSKLFNYNKALRRLKDFDTIYDYCDCKDKYAEFIYEPHGHVHTGQLSIIKNTDLRQVMSKGAKFRVTPSVQKAKIISTIKDSILKLKRKYASKCRIKEVCFDLWFDRILQCVDNCSKSINNLHLESNDIFNLPEVVEYVHTLHNRFVIVPVDKASNNFAIICKTFYFSVLMK